MQRDLSAPRAQQQVAALIQSKLLHALESNPDCAWVSARRNYEILFKLSLVAVINQVHSLIDVAEFNSRISPYARPPLPGLIAVEIVDLARRFLAPFHTRAHWTTFDSLFDSFANL
jgi:hypothetical protein